MKVPGTLLLMAGLEFGGCAAAPIGNPALTAIEVTAKDNGAVIDLQSAQHLIVRLKSIPATGYRWSLVDSAQGVMRVAEDAPAFEQEPKSLDLIGAGGYELWKFTPVGKGEAVIRFEYRRPWEHGIEPIDTAMYTVKVR